MSLTGIAFLLSFFAGCWMALTKHPVWGLVCYIAVFYLHPPSRWWGETLPDLRWSLTSAAVAMVGLIIHRKRLVDKPKLASTGLFIGLAVFTCWLIVQFGWALAINEHGEFVILFVKYLFLIYIMYHVIDSPEHLKVVLWAHVLGCTYLGWLVYTNYGGGRFENFGGPGIGEANAGALQLATGAFTMGALFLAGKNLERAAVIACAPLVLNGIVSTVSRSAFLGLFVGGLLFVHFSPGRYKGRVVILGSLALVLFVMLTNPNYWERISSIAAMGAEVEGVNTGSQRLELIAAQLKMARDFPMGTGHRGTAVLSRFYMADHLLTGSGDLRGRSSHSTVLTMLVEQGPIGILFYVLMAFWSIRNLRKLMRASRATTGIAATFVPTLAAVIGAILIGDQFVDYAKSEVRIWFFAFLVVLLEWIPKGAESTARKRSKPIIGLQKPAGHGPDSELASDAPRRRRRRGIIGSGR